MRDFKSLFNDLTQKPPLLFPFVCLFHILCLLWVIYDIMGTRLGLEDGIRVLWMLVYTIFWLAVCDLRKWGALGYLFLTLLNATLYISIKSPYYHSVIVSSFFLLDGIFSFFILFFYKKFL